MCFGPKGQRSVNLIGTDPHFAHLAGPLLRHFTAAQLSHQQAFALPAPIAQSMGLLSLSPVKLQIGGRLVGVSLELSCCAAISALWWTAQ